MIRRLLIHVGKTALGLYYDLNRTDLWHPTGDAEEFSELMDFIRTLPFETTGRMIIMYDDSGRAVSAHRDHDSIDLCHEFIWFRTNLDKPFYMLNPANGENSMSALTRLGSIR